MTGNKLQLTDIWLIEHMNDCIEQIEEIFDEGKTNMLSIEDMMVLTKDNKFDGLGDLLEMYPEEYIRLAAAIAIRRLKI